MPLSDETKLALAFAEESSKRTRRVTLFIQIAAIVTIIAAWQEIRSTWVNRRLIIAQKAEWGLSCRPDFFHSLPSPAPPGQPTSLPLYFAQPARSSEKIPSESKLLQEIAEVPALAYKCSYLPFASDNLPNETREERQNRQESELAQLKSEVSDYLREWGYSLEQVRTNVQDLQHIVNNRVLNVGIPVLGVSFDVNDLSVVCGFSFAILLTWLRFSLGRLRDNICEVFVRADPRTTAAPSELADAYDLLAMTQVLNVPKLRRKASDLDWLSVKPEKTAENKKTIHKPFAHLWTRIVKMKDVKATLFMLWTGFGVQLWAFAEDVKTSDYGGILNQTLSRAENAVAFVLTVWVLWKTLQCHRIINDIDLHWTNALGRARSEAA